MKRTLIACGILLGLLSTAAFAQRARLSSGGSIPGARLPDAVHNPSVGSIPPSVSTTPSATHAKSVGPSAASKPDAKTVDPNATTNPDTKTIEPNATTSPDIRTTDPNATTRPDVRGVNSNAVTPPVSK